MQDWQLFASPHSGRSSSARSWWFCWRSKAATVGGSTDESQREGPRIEDNYYLVDGEPKRFFHRASVEALFATGWRMLSLEERVIKRYAKPKVAWEAVLERDA